MNRSALRLRTYITAASGRMCTTSDWERKIRDKVALKLQSGQTPEYAAWTLLGDKRLINEIEIHNGVAYVRGEKLGPPARYAGTAPRRPGK